MAVWEPSEKQQTAVEVSIACMSQVMLKQGVVTASVSS